MLAKYNAGHRSMTKSICSVGRIGLSFAMLVALSAGCAKSDSASQVGDTAPGASSQSSPSTAQAVQAVRNNPQLSEQMKSRIAEQIQNPSGRPAGAPAMPTAPTH